MDLVNLFIEMEKKKNFKSGDGISDAEITTLETRLNIKLSDSYLIFLKKYSYAYWFGGAIFGYTTNNNFDALNITLKARNESIPVDFRRIPYDGIVINTYGGGGYYLLFSQDSSRKGQVALFTDDEMGNEVDCWKTFDEYLEWQLEG